MKQEVEETVWSGADSRLDRVLAELGLARSRSAAAEIISSGKVLVNQKKANKPATKVASGSTVSLLETQTDFGRGAQKLRHALALFGIHTQNKLCLDVGASTGGFTQVLLENAAAKVIALDVGHGQLVPQLREDPRVITVEGCNARYLNRNQLGDLAGTLTRPEIIVTDVSFISVTLLFEAFKDVAAADCDIVLLVKPQFEVGKENIGAGVVTDPKLHAQALQAVITAAASYGFSVKGLADSPILGNLGNREFLLHLQPAPKSQTAPEKISGWITKASELVERA